MEYDYLILAHTHYRFLQKVGKTTVINPGSLGQPRDKNGFSYCVLDTKTGSCTFKNVNPNISELLEEVQKKDGDKYIDFDKGVDDVENIINTFYDADGMKYAKAYYAALAQLPDHGNFDIIGHFDLITKHCETRKFFDTESKEYITAALDAMEALRGKIPFFELNTGAMARGYRTSPYPNVLLLKELKRLGFGAVITSDCHDKTKLNYKFDEAADILKECGYKEKYILTKSGFEAVSI